MTSSPKRRGSERPATVRRPQARGLATRARVLEAARDLFTRHGYEGSSIGDVAERASVGVGTVYHHFPDKRSLLLELLDDWARRMADDPSGGIEPERFLGDDPRGAIVRWLRGSYERLRSRPSLYLAALALAGRDPEIELRYRRIEALDIERITLVIRAGLAKGFMRPDLDVDTAAFLVHHAIDMAATQVLVRGGGGEDPDAVVAGLSDMICRFLLSAAYAGGAAPD